MARANFGGQQDASQTFMFLYEQYAQRQEQLAQQAVRQAEEDQAAADQDAMNRWEAGEMSDDEWLAYAKQRLSESTDEEDKTAWREVLRNSQEQITVRRIEKGAEDLMNKIEAGTATWQDLRNFYTRERAKLKEGSEMYRDLSGQIDQINDTIRDNATEAAIGEAQYLFQSGQISGTEAANRIRAAAERYRVNDPGRYYQLLSSAYDLQTYGAGGAGGGGGGGGGGPSLSSTIDSLEWTADAIDVLNRQFNGGKRVGTLPDGTEVPLADENGNPTQTWREIDRHMLETLDAMYEAKRANGDRDAGEALDRKEAYILDSVQPRNTIPREAQFNALTRDLQRAAASGDPKAIESVLGSMERWSSRLNTRTTSTDVEKRASDEKVRENPELAAAARRQTTGEADELDQTTDEFAANVQAAVRGYRVAFDNPAPTPEQVAANAEAAGPLANVNLMAGIETVSTKTHGLADGSFVRVMLQDGTMDAVPLVSRSTPVSGPNGEQSMVRELAPDLDVDFGSQGVAQVLREINGRPELVWAVGDYRNVEGQRVLTISDGRNVMVKPENGMWMDGRGGEQMLPFFGASDSNAQRWVNQNPEAAAAMLQSNGVDPTTVDMSNLFYRSDRLVESREDEVNRDYNFQRQLADRPQGRSRNPAVTGTISSREGGRDFNPAYMRGTTGQGPRSVGGSFGGGLSMVEGLGQQLGINFKVQDRGVGGAKLRGNRPQMIDMPDIRTPTRVNVRTPNIRQVNVRPVAPIRLSLPDFRNLRTRRAAQQTQLHDIRKNSPTGYV